MRADVLGLVLCSTSTGRHSIQPEYTRKPEVAVTVPDEDAIDRGCADFDVPLYGVQANHLRAPVRRAGRAETKTCSKPH